MDHLDRDIAELERPCKKMNSNIFLLPSSNYDNTSADLLDLAFVDGQLVNPFVWKRKLRTNVALRPPNAGQAKWMK